MRLSSKTAVAGPAASYPCARTRPVKASAIITRRVRGLRMGAANYGNDGSKSGTTLCIIVARPELSLPRGLARHPGVCQWFAAVLVPRTCAVSSCVRSQRTRWVSTPRY